MHDGYVNQQPPSTPQMPPVAPAPVAAPSRSPQRRTRGDAGRLAGGGRRGQV